MGFPGPRRAADDAKRWRQCQIVLVVVRGFGDRGGGCRIGELLNIDVRGAGRQRPSRSWRRATSGRKSQVAVEQCDRQTIFGPRHEFAQRACLAAQTPRRTRFVNHISRQRDANDVIAHRTYASSLRQPCRNNQPSRRREDEHSQWHEIPDRRHVQPSPAIRASEISVRPLSVPTSVNVLTPWLISLSQASLE